MWVVRPCQIRKDAETGPNASTLPKAYSAATPSDIPLRGTLGARPLN